MWVMVWKILFESFRVDLQNNVSSGVIVKIMSNILIISHHDLLKYDKIWWKVLSGIVLLICSHYHHGIHKKCWFFNHGITFSCCWYPQLLFRQYSSIPRMFVGWHLWAILQRRLLYFNIRFLIPASCVGGRMHHWGHQTWKWCKLWSLP